jgi:hypothetical protein
MRIATVLVVLLSLAFSGHRVTTCTIVTHPWIAPRATNRFIVRPLAERVPAGSSIQPRLQPFPTAHTLDTIPVFGQLLSVDTVVGPDADQLRVAFSKLGRAVIIVVPWGIDAACQRRAWTSDTLYLQKGKQAFVATSLRSPSNWINGIPTVDSDSIADLYQPPIANRRGANDQLQATDYMGLFEVLPNWNAWRHDPPGEARKLRHWVQSHGIGRNARVSELLSAMDQWLQDWRHGYNRDSTQ